MFHALLIHINILLLKSVCHSVYLCGRIQILTVSQIWSYFCLIYCGKVFNVHSEDIGFTKKLNPRLFEHEKSELLSRIYLYVLVNFRGSS